MSELDLLIEKLSYAQRKRLPSKDFVFPDADGKGGRWPIQSAKQALIAIDFMQRGRGKESEYGEIRKAIEARFGRNKRVMAALNSTNEAIEEQESLEEASKKVELSELSPRHQKQAKAIAKLLNGKIVEVWDGEYSIVVVKSSNPQLSAAQMKILSRTVRWISRRTPFGGHSWRVGF